MSPVHLSIDQQGRYAQWGNHGHRYRYQSGDKRSRDAAKAAAERQGAAAYANGYREGKGIDHLQSVLFHRPDWTPAQARTWLKRHGDKFRDEEDRPTQLRFRQQDPRTFPKYREKKLPGGINLVLGYKGMPRGLSQKAKDHIAVGQAIAKRFGGQFVTREGYHGDAHGVHRGEGFGDWLNKAKNLAASAINAVRGKAPEIRESWPPNIRKWISDHMTDNIIRIEVRRMPIASGIDKAINALSIGRWEAAKKDLGYSNLFHLYLVLYFASGEKARCERNAVLEMSKWHGDNAEVRPVSLPKPITLPNFLNNAAAFALRNGEDVHRYKADTQNCQRWVIQCLQGNGLLTPELRQFTEQDAASLVARQSPLLRRIMQGSTDLAHRFDVALEGKGFRSR